MDEEDKIDTLTEADSEFLRQMAKDNFREYVGKEQSVQDTVLDRALAHPRLNRYQKVVVRQLFLEYIRRMTAHLVRQYDDTKSRQSSLDASSVKSGASSLDKMKAAATANAEIISEEFIGVWMTGKRAGVKAFAGILALLKGAMKEALDEADEDAKNQAMVGSRKRKRLQEALASFMDEHQSSSDVRARVTEWVITQQQAKHITQ